jgi:thioredoxin reductase (NADPH)
MPEHNLQSIAFPTLDETQIAGLAGCTTATPKFYRDGQTLFAVGDRDFNFFIVKSGEIEIVDHSGDAPKTLTVHQKGGPTQSSASPRPSVRARWPSSSAFHGGAVALHSGR